MCITTLIQRVLNLYQDDNYSERITEIERKVESSAVELDALNKRIRQAEIALGIRYGNSSISSK